MRVAERLQRAQLSSKVVTSEVIRRSARNVESGQHLQALQDRMTDKSHGTRGALLARGSATQALLTAHQSKRRCLGCMPILWRFAGPLYA